MKPIDTPCPISPIGYLNPFGHETLLRARGIDVPAAAVLQSMRSGLGCVPEAGVPVVLASDAAAGWAQAQQLARELGRLLQVCAGVSGAGECVDSARAILANYRALLADGAPLAPPLPTGATHCTPS